MGRRNEHTREELREISLRAAEQLVAAHGLSGLSARKIASAIGYTVGSLYMVFRNLDDLILQMNERTLDQLYARLADAVTHAEQPSVGSIRALAQAYLGFALAETNRWLALYEHRMAEAQTAPDSFSEKVARMFELVQHHLALLSPQRPPQWPAPVPHDYREVSSFLTSTAHGSVISAASLSSSVSRIR